MIEGPAVKRASGSSSGPNTCSASCRSSTEPPMVTMMMRSGSPSPIGRIASSSKSAPTAAVSATAPTTASGQRQAEAREPHAEHAAEHVELALREVDGAGRREDDREPERDERVDRPVLETRDDELEELPTAATRQRPSRLVWITGPAPMRRS